MILYRIICAYVTGCGKHASLLDSILNMLISKSKTKGQLLSGANIEFLSISSICSFRDFLLCKLLLCAQRASWPPVSLWKSSSFSVSLCCRERVDKKMYPPMYSCTTLQSAFTQLNAMLMFPSNSIATLK